MTKLQWNSAGPGHTPLNECQGLGAACARLLSLKRKCYSLVVFAPAPSPEPLLIFWYTCGFLCGKVKPTKPGMPEVGQWCSGIFHCCSFHAQDFWQQRGGSWNTEPGLQAVISLGDSVTPRCPLYAFSALPRIKGWVHPTSCSCYLAVATDSLCFSEEIVQLAASFS